MPLGSVEKADCARLGLKFERLADNSLRRAVLARLISAPLVSARHIEVTAIAGRVTLSGYVTSNAQKEAGRVATRRLKGVEHVSDEVIVAVPCPAILAASPPQRQSAILR